MLWVVAVCLLALILWVMVRRNRVPQVEIGITKWPFQPVTWRKQTIPIAKERRLIGIVREAVVIHNCSNNNDLLMAAPQIRDAQGWNSEIETHGLANCWHRFHFKVFPAGPRSKNPFWRAVWSAYREGRLMDYRVYVTRRNMPAVYNRQRDDFGVCVYCGMPSNNIGSLRNMKSILCGIGGTLRSICGFLVGAVHQSGQSSINDDENKPCYFDAKAKFISGLLIFFGGIALLFKALWSCRFNAATNLNTASHVALAILVCASLIWIGMWLAVSGFGCLPDIEVSRETRIPRRPQGWREL